MKLFEKFSKFFGIISVKQIGNQIRITGIDGLIMRKYFKDSLATDAVNKTMFTDMNDTAITLNQFFLPDFIYLLNRIKADPKCGWGAKRTVDKILHGINGNTWWKRTLEPQPVIIDPSKQKLLKWTPLQHQVDFLEFFGTLLPKYDLRGALLGAPPGTGKTFIDFLVATCVIPPSVAQVKIIISPKKAVHLVWEKTLKALFYKPPTSWVTGSGRPMPLENTEYYIFNYEQLDQAITLGKHLVSKGIRYFAVVDESHNFADYRSNRTQKLVQLQTLRDDIYFIWASGSPILKMGAELSSFLKCADKRFDEDAERRFRKIYTNAPGRANEIFNHRLGLMMAFLVPKSVVKPPKLTVKELPVKLPPAIAHKFLMSTVRQEMRDFIEERLTIYKPLLSGYQKFVNEQLAYHERGLNTRPERKLFDEYRKNLKLVMRNPDIRLVEPLTMLRNYERAKLVPSLLASKRAEFRSSLSAIKNIKMKVRGEALGKVLSKRRSECAAYLGMYCHPETIMKESLSKTLFFASSVLPVKVLGKHLENEGFEPVMVFSDTNSQLTQMMQRFEMDPNVNPVIATMQSLSEAVPVIAASTVVLLNRPYRQAVWDQVVARAWRLGQIYEVTVFEVTLDTGGEPNVSSTADAILSDIREIMREILGETFAGPSPDEREYKDAIDASDREHLALFDTETEVPA